MPVFVELLVALLIAYGAVLALSLPLMNNLSRMRRLKILRELRKLTRTNKDTS